MGKQTDLLTAIKLLFPGIHPTQRCARWLGISQRSLWDITQGRNRLTVRHRNRLLQRVDAGFRVDEQKIVDAVRDAIDRDVAGYEEAGQIIRAIDPAIHASSRPLRRVGRPRSRVARLTREAVTSSE